MNWDVLNWLDLLNWLDWKVPSWGLWGPLVFSLLLTLGWLWFFVRFDRHPEPLWLVARTFAWGAFAWVVAVTFEASLGRFLSSDFPMMLLVVLFTAVIEEGCKFVAASTAVTEPSFDEPMDGLVYAVTAALGFAFAENITYILKYGSSAVMWHVPLATLVHALLSAPQGYALGGLHWPDVHSRLWVVQGLGLSIILHVVFNGILKGEASFLTVLALAVVVILMAVLATRYYLAFIQHAEEYGPPAYFKHMQGSKQSSQSSSIQAVDIQVSDIQVSDIQTADIQASEIQISAKQDSSDINI